MSSKTISLDGREIGHCPICRKSVTFGDNFVRQGDVAAHVTCVIGLRQARRFVRDGAAWGRPEESA
jgi:hypothetical protein